MTPLRRTATASVLAASLAFPWVVAQAHDYWVERREGAHVLVYGHGDERVEFDPATLKRIVAFESEGKLVQITGEPKGKKSVALRTPEGTSVVAAELDSGYWSKTIYGLKNLPKRKASRVVEAFRNLHYTKTVLAWSPAALRSVEGQRLEIVPLKKPGELKGGEALPVRVLFEGRPAAGTEIEKDHGKVAVADADGVAQVRLGKGRQLLSVERKEPLRGDPDADYLLATATLTFEMPK